MPRKKRKNCDVCWRPATWVGDGMMFCEEHSPLELHKTPAVNFGVEPKLVFVDTDAAVLYGFARLVSESESLKTYAPKLRIIADRLERPHARKRAIIKWSRLDAREYAPLEPDVVERAGLVNFRFDPFGSNPIQNLKEAMDRAGLALPVYGFTKSGADHEPHFCCTLDLDFPVNRLFVGQGGSKKAAKRDAAFKALQYFKKSAAQFS